jgi:hypothetical protein
MDPEKKLESEINEYVQVAKENKNVDVAALMMYSLKNENKNLVSSKSKRWAYSLSVGVPPLGLLFALHYYMADYDDGTSVANMCIILTIVSVVSIWLLSKMLLSNSGTNLDELSKTKTSDILELVK